ncbi:RNA polymerase alpha subunit C-terminal domain-containing protein [Dyadobacter sp. CY323]|uniref:RNA polymerase alpha subunit C-terminal domain-containing protein n=1 Tax=Dyadobacter sp. CY323 TaxID=2907302 RepID=UPI001F3B634C|nr:RNA polymerase alpha subunit C-terminal domain-containing protein [Dyadobacter sp. CY323]MCE6987611.1 RNA polymerase alpha subunit C-terminal domain-containing protein [Dyadobacter sp. CY323]
MVKQKGTLKICLNGHKYYKSTDCPTCPVCEAEHKPETGFLSLLANPARRALENNGVSTLNQLSRLTEKEVLKFHGMGPASMPVLKNALEKAGLAFTLTEK